MAQQTKPKDRRALVAGIIFVLILVPGSALYYYGNPAPATTTKTTATTNPVPVEYGTLRDVRGLTMQGLLIDAEGFYYGSPYSKGLGISALYSGDLSISMSNVTLQDALGFAYLAVSSGTLSVQPSGAGLQFSFSGATSTVQASGTYAFSSFVFVYTPTTTTTNATTTQGSISASDLSAGFSLLPGSIQTEIVAAINASPNPGAQVSYLSSELAGQASILNQIPGLAGKGSDYAAAFLLNLSTAGTSLANTAYASLLGSTTTTTTTNSTSTSSTVTSSS